MIGAADPAWPFLEAQEAKWEEAGKQVLKDAEDIVDESENKFAATVRVAEAANDYLVASRQHEGAHLRKPVLAVIRERAEERAGRFLPDYPPADSFQY
eukprot:SM002748S10382  [mRNA]  locus=s2748:313:788:+ [translate_table: standard]